MTDNNDDADYLDVDESVNIAHHATNCWVYGAHSQRLSWAGDWPDWPYTNAI